MTSWSRPSNWGSPFLCGRQPARWRFGFATSVVHSCLSPSGINYYESCRVPLTNALCSDSIKCCTLPSTRLWFMKNFLGFCQYLRCQWLIQCQCQFTWRLLCTHLLPVANGQGSMEPANKHATSTQKATKGAHLIFFFLDIAVFLSYQDWDNCIHLRWWFQKVSQ